MSATVTQPPPEQSTLGDIEVPEKIHLRLKLCLRDLHIEKDEALAIASPDAHNIEIRYRRPNTDELHLGAEWNPPLSLGSSICEVAGQWGISSKNRLAFTKLAKEGVGELTETIVVFGAAAGRTGMPAWDALPESLQSLLESAERDLGRCATKTHRLLRWFLALEGAHNPFLVWSYSWSPDGIAWQDLPQKLPIRIASNVPAMRPSLPLKEAIEKALCAGRNEPAGHELLREALHQVDENPRSALIVGIAAAEVGLKEFASRAAPVCSWLVTEAPSPNLLIMLTEFLPDILTHLKAIPDMLFLQGKDKKGYNDPVLRELQRGMTMRNAFVHKPASAPDAEDVKPVLAAVRNLLGMLDHYSGGTPLGRSFISVTMRQIWWHPDAKRPD